MGGVAGGEELFALYFLLSSGGVRERGGPTCACLKYQRTCWVDSVGVGVELGL
jgi:hypothetical protein